MVKLCGRLNCQIQLLPLIFVPHCFQTKIRPAIFMSEFVKLDTPTSLWAHSARYDWFCKVIASLIFDWQCWTTKAEFDV